MSEENVIGYAYYTIVFAFICILCPIRTCIQLNLKDAQDFQSENSKDYNDVALTFPSDYDKANPLTSKAGQVRLLNMQMEEARAKGDEETVKMLESQLGIVKQQSSF